MERLSLKHLRHTVSFRKVTLLLVCPFDLSPKPVDSANRPGKEVVQKLLSHRETSAKCK